MARLGLGRAMSARKGGLIHSEAAGPKFRQTDLNFLNVSASEAIVFGAS